VSLAVFLAVRSLATERFRALALPWVFMLIPTSSLAWPAALRDGRREIFIATPVPTRRLRASSRSAALVSAQGSAPARGSGAMPAPTSLLSGECAAPTPRGRPRAKQPGANGVDSEGIRRCRETHIL